MKNFCTLHFQQSSVENVLQFLLDLFYIFLSIREEKNEVDN